MPRMLLVALATVALASVAHAGDDPIFAPGAKLKTEAANGSGGEGPAWDPKLGVLTSGGGRIYRLDPDAKVTRVIGRELDRPNGVLVSADDRYLYVADNNNDTKGGARKLWRFDLKKDGTVDFASRKMLYDWDTGRGPDGLKQDQEGRL